MAPWPAAGALIIEGQHGPGARSLILLTILDAAFQFGSHPAYSSVGNNTRGSMAQLSIPDQGSYLELCTMLSSEINNNKSIKMVTKGGRNVPKPNYLHPGTLRLLHFDSAVFCLQPVAIIIVFLTLYSSSCPWGWCGTKPKESSLYSYLSTSHCNKHYL